MDELSVFIHNLPKPKGELSLEEARMVVNQINEFLYTTNYKLGKTKVLGLDLDFFSKFHKYWEKHHKEILDCQIDENTCKEVAKALYEVYKTTNGKAFKEVFDTFNLTPKEICKVRFLTANQDFRDPISFKRLAERYKDDPSKFDPSDIVFHPEKFLSWIGLSATSQSDKRVQYAQRISQFLLDNNCNEPYDLLSKFDYDLSKLREAIIGITGGGYGNKKTDMFLRDMIVLKVWLHYTKFESINVASDINTIKVALRTEIIKTKIPLVTSVMYH